ncbi:MAG: hypothetical protein R3A78_07520 [Polyangiales bacterium]|nr:hypothetical protein [Myxococcales bacterium]
MTRAGGTTRRKVAQHARAFRALLLVGAVLGAFLGAAACEGSPSGGPAATQATRGTQASAPEAASPGTGASGGAPPNEPPTLNGSSAVDEGSSSAPGALPRAVGKARPPARGCVAIGAPARISRMPAPPAVTAWRNETVVATLEVAGATESLRLWRVGASGVRSWLAKPVPEDVRRVRIAPPALLADTGANSSDAVDVALVAGDGKVRVATVRANGTSTDWLPFGDRADERFTPALARAGEDLMIAWTRVEAGASRLWLTRTRASKVVGSVDVSPPGMGGLAPVFVREGNATALYFMDAREGTSPVVRAVLGEDGTLGAPEVLRPVGTSAALPELAVALAGKNPFIAYTVIGKAASTAIGIFSIKTKDFPPTALVPGTGYGILHVAAATGLSRAVFAADVPLGADPKAPREVVLHVVDDEGMGPPLALRGPTGSASNVAMARTPDGTYAVAYADGAGTHLAFTACDDGSAAPRTP